MRSVLVTAAGEPMRYFLAHVDDETDECILWPYGKDRDGYGVVPPNRRAHRMACERAHGPMPEPRCEAAHACHTPACFNARHLSWATRQQNEDAKTEAGRRPPGKVTTAMRVAIIADPRTTREIGREYGLSSRFVSSIKRGLRH